MCQASHFWSLQHSHLHWNLTSLNNNPGRGIRSGVRSPCTIARRRYGFERIQAKLCRNSMETMPHVQSAAILAAETCREVFKNRRWNCSSIVTAPFLSADLTRATREQAYVYAISSATLTYTMARACSSGSLYHCTCASKPNIPSNEQFQWGGCGDNVKWGAQFAKRFIDNVEKYALENRKNKRSDAIGSREEDEVLKNEVAAVNLHNNKVGRKVMADSLRTQCKCHGVSGSCNIKTCWKALPPMSEIGHKLLKKYTNAVELSRTMVERSITERLVKKLKNRDARSQSLIYISKSPDYCTKDDKLGSFGTVGRQCNVTSSGPESCRQLCCGRGYRTVVDEKIERCQCKFYNCCYVKCKICRTMTQIHECL
nr:protein Wnt-11b-1-like [Leptinotarsa decemlineata]